METTKKRTYADLVRLGLLEPVFERASKIYGNKCRKNGANWLQHIERVLNILVEEWELTNLPEDMVIATILKDILNPQHADNPISREQLEIEFDKDVADLVHRVSNLKNDGAILAKGKVSGASLHKRLTLDFKAATIRIADRLDIIRNIDDLPKAKRKEIARALYELYIPYCRQLSMLLVEEEFKRCALKVISPEEFQKANDLLGLYEKHKQELEGFAADLRRTLLKGNDLVEGKLTRKELAVEVVPIDHFAVLNQVVESQKTALSEVQLGDLVRFKIVTKNESECYTALRILQTTRDFVALPIEESDIDSKRIDEDYVKDYISQPKANGYAGIVAIFGLKQEFLDISNTFDTFTTIIRTRAMDYASEIGYPAIWHKNPISSNHFPKLQAREDIKENDDGSKRIISKDGAVHTIDARATALDFAYSIHSEVGHRFQHAIVNGKQVAPGHELKDGDIVEILRSNRPQAPNPKWCEYVNLTNSKYHIRRYKRKSASLKLFVRTYERAGVIHDISAAIYNSGLSFSNLMAFSHGGYGFFFIDIASMPKAEITLLKYRLKSLPSVIEVAEEDDLEKMQPYNPKTMLQQQMQKVLGVSSSESVPVVTSADTFGTELTDAFKEVESSPLELKLLRLLASSFNKLVSYETCIDALYEPEEDTSSSLANLQKVKARLNDTLKEKTRYIIESKRKKGYLLTKQ